ncbi:EamA-like transporter family protein [Roseovarius sp. THAF27]|uniref:DMT family transporter n=1 Tax=Roseovarius sp. THAF27 TaxID=2587850 RepID=UPI001267D42A|nr:DMT family transporter [Roseovarius sp. THAF27]QFT81064.1 EamA-like transporter family protein [Roseovarius sp. THAF27]
MTGRATEVVALGVVLTVAYTLLITGADAITKLFSANYAAPQMFAFSGGLVALFCLLVGRKSAGTTVLKTRCPRVMALRAVATVIGTCAFFYAFKLLPFAEVFLFIAIIPILAALLSRLVLQERPGGQVWGALLLGLVGMTTLFPSGFHSFGTGHLVALLAVTMGAISMVSSRYIGQRDPAGLLSQVFYPNAALMAVMACVLPFVFVPMGWGDVMWIVCYAALLFAARWVLVAALRILPAYVVTPLMNLQFLWMVALGTVAFGEPTGAGVFFGASLLILAGAWLVWDQVRTPLPKAAVPAE